MSTAVLVADNSATMRKIIIRSLNALGVTDIAEAGDGFEALELFQENSFKLVVTEWIMPQVSGLDVIRVIRKQGSNVPIIMATTQVEKARVLEAIQAGVSDYIVKQFTTELLREKLEKHLRA
jgi:two-component system chemotaxis response regulator CheY